MVVLSSIFAAIAGASVGALVTLVVKAKLDRNAESRAARRLFYTELATMLTAAARVMQQASNAPDDRLPDILADEAVDAFNARLAIDASEEVRRRTERCLRLIQRFQVSHVLRVPVEEGEDELYNHRWDLVADQPDQVRQMHMRVALGKILEEYRPALDRVTAQIRQEIGA